MKQQPKKSAPKGQMGLDGEVAEGGISGDDGQQGMLFGSPATTGEGLTVESTPLFAGTMVPLRELLEKMAAEADGRPITIMGFSDG